MKTREKILKVASRSFLCVVLSVSVIFSSFSFSLAFEIPEPIAPVPFDFVVELQSARDWVANMLENDPDGNIMVYKDMRTPQYNSNIWIWYIPADISIYVEPSNGYIYANGRYGMAGIYQYWLGDGTTGYNNMTNQFPGNNSIQVDGVTYYRFGGINQFYHNPDAEFYFSADFMDTGGGVYANLDISSYLPDQHLLSCSLTDDKKYVVCTVNYDIDTTDSYTTLWGYSDFGALTMNYSNDEYEFPTIELLPDGVYTTFYLDLSKLFAYYQIPDAHISSVSHLGWSDAYEQYTSVDWDLSVVNTPDHDPPDTNFYYSSFVNEYYSYNNDNGRAVSFGYIHLLLTTQSASTPYYWDDKETLIQPYKFSVFAFPLVNQLQTQLPYDELASVLDFLTMSYDVILLDVPETTFDHIYGSGAYSDFFNDVYFGQGFNVFYSSFQLWVTSHPPVASPLPYEFLDEKDEWYHTGNQTVGVLYTDSFFLKSLAYLMGDSNDRLLELETRLLGEDGFAQELFRALNSIYSLEKDTYDELLPYLRSMNYFVNTILRNDYFEKYLSEFTSQTSWLASIYSKLDAISDAITDVGGEDYEDDLGEPWLTFYNFFRSIFDGSLDLLDDFRRTVGVFIDSDSSAVGLDFYLDDDYEQYMPLIDNPLTPTPTPIPIPTLFP